MRKGILITVITGILIFTMASTGMAGVSARFAHEEPGSGFEGNIGGLLGSLEQKEEGNEMDLVPGAVKVRPEEETKPQTVESDPGTMEMTGEAFLIVNDLKNVDASAYIVEAGTVLSYTAEAYEMPDIMVLSVDQKEVTVSTDEGAAIREKGQLQGDGIFTIGKGEEITLVSGSEAEEEEIFRIEFVDVSIYQVADPLFFEWDMNMDGTKEQVELFYVDNGDEARSGFAVEVFDQAEDWMSWEAWLEGLYEITELRIITGPIDNFLIIEGFFGDFYVHDIPGTIVIIFDNDTLQVLESSGQ